MKDEGGAGETASKLHEALVAAGVRARLDDRVDTTFGRRAVDWELKGVPVRLEVGPRDLAEGNVTVVRRDTGPPVASPRSPWRGRSRPTLDRLASRDQRHAGKRYQPL